MRRPRSRKRPPPRSRSPTFASVIVIVKVVVVKEALRTPRATLGSPCASWPRCSDSLPSSPRSSGRGARAPTQSSCSGGPQACRTRHHTYAAHTRHPRALHVCYTHATEYERAQLEDTAQLPPAVILRGLLCEEELRSVSDHAEQLCAATGGTGGTGGTGAGAERWVPCGEAHRKLFLHAVGDGRQRAFGAACPLLLAKLVRLTV